MENPSASRAGCDTQSSGVDRFSSAQDRPSDGLVLLAQNPCAARSLQRRLADASLRYTTDTGCVIVSVDGMTHEALADALRKLLPRALQRAVKAAFAEPPANEEALSDVMLGSEPLCDVLDQADVQWARSALCDGWLTTLFQPIVDAASQRVFAYEALMRAVDPRTHEILGAHRLLYACGRLNLCHELDTQARTAAIRNGASMLPRGATLFINLLHNAVYDAVTCLGATIEEAREQGLSTSQLVFELDDLDPRDLHGHVGPILEYLRAQGAAVALDNIGGGWSPLELIADLRPDFVKLDRALVTDAPLLTSARRTLDAVVDLARRLQMRVVAQGVETPEQATVCSGAGVDYLQGYLFARPSSPPEAVAQLPFMQARAVA